MFPTFNEPVAPRRSPLQSLLEEEDNDIECIRPFGRLQDGPGTNTLEFKQGMPAHRRMFNVFDTPSGDVPKVQEETRKSKINWGKYQESMKIGQRSTHRLSSLPSAQPHSSPFAAHKFRPNAAKRLHKIGPPSCGSLLKDTEGPSEGNISAAGSSDSCMDFPLTDSMRETGLWSPDPAKGTAKRLHMDWQTPQASMHAAPVSCNSPAGQSSNAGARNTGQQAAPLQGQDAVAAESFTKPAAEAPRRTLLIDKEDTISGSGSVSKQRPDSAMGSPSARRSVHSITAAFGKANETGCAESEGESQEKDVNEYKTVFDFL